MPAHSLYDINALFRELAQGNETAFRQIFDLYKHRVQSVALKMLRDTADADEIVQEVFLKVWTHQAQFKKIDDPEGFLFTTVYNTIYNWIRKTANEEKAMSHLVAVVRAEQALHGEQIILAGETKAIIEQAVESLPDQRKLIFRMSRNDGLSYEEIAERLNLSKNTVHNQITQALQTIRAVLARTAMSLVLMAWNNF